jgi:hypothetical protein
MPRVEIAIHLAKTAAANAVNLLSTKVNIIAQAAIIGRNNNYDIYSLKIGARKLAPFFLFPLYICGGL